MMACLPIAFGGLLSAVCQGKVAAASVNILAKKPDDWSKGMILCITVGVLRDTLPARILHDAQQHHSLITYTGQEIL